MNGIIDLYCYRGHHVTYEGPISDLMEMKCPRCKEMGQEVQLAGTQDEAHFLAKLQLWLEGMGKTVFPVTVRLSIQGYYKIKNKTCPQFHGEGKDLLSTFRLMSVPVDAINQFALSDLAFFNKLGRNIYKATFLSVVGVDCDGFHSSTPLVFGDNITSNFAEWDGSQLEKDTVEHQLKVTYAVAKQAAARKNGPMWTILLPTIFHW